MAPPNWVIPAVKPENNQVPGYPALCSELSLKPSMSLNGLLTGKAVRIAAMQIPSDRVLPRQQRVLLW